MIPTQHQYKYVFFIIGNKISKQKLIHIIIPLTTANILIPTVQVYVITDYWCQLNEAILKPNTRL
jgi:hypothetical protein